VLGLLLLVFLLWKARYTWKTSEAMLIGKKQKTKNREQSKATNLHYSL
jgi:hypothetical protein